MGKLNLLKGRYTGKVGETVGAKWKDKSTLRTFSIPANPRTAEQQSVRGVFGSMATFVALFADLIKYKSALDTSGMSVRNAIVKINKAQIDAGTFAKGTLLISKGGLQKPAVPTAALAGNAVTLTLTPPTATNFTEDAKAIAVFVDATKGIADMKEVAYDATSVSSGALFAGSTSVDCYLYYLDKRGTSKVGSESVYVAASA